MAENTPILSATTEMFKTFQLSNVGQSKKSSKEWGLNMAQAIDSTVQTGVGNSYYWNRNSRFLVNRNYANGKIPMQRFMDQLDFAGKFNYANINWSCIKIVNRIISGLVGQWMQLNERVSVRAIDSLSVTQKDDEYAQMEFYIAQRQKLEQLQQESGVQMIPQGPIPANQEQLDIWQAHVQRLPEEILYEIGCNECFTANGLSDVIKRKLLHDSAEVGLVATHTWMDEQGVIHVDHIKPENTIYSYTDFPDFRDTTWRGQVKSMKISEIRAKYGKQFGGDLSEEEMWKIAQSAKEYKLYDTLRWDNYWNSTLIRPYDEWNVDVIDFEFKSDDAEGYTVTKTKGTQSTLLQKGRPDKLKDNQQYIEDKKWNIYRGVYVRVTQTLLEWGLKKNMIRPQDPKELGDCEFSYSFYMYQSYDMYNVAVPEKIQEPVDQMIIARLKMQQLVATMRPVGSAINWDAIQNIDYGLGDKNKEIDVVKMYNQTGNIYYRGKDAEGNPMPVPIVELQNSGFLGQMQGLIAIYDKNYAILKDELGEDPNIQQQALQPRVTSGNVNVAQQTAENATDYMYDAVRQVLKDTARKVACLMKNSVTYGSKVYRELMKKEDVEGRIFSTDIEMMPTETELAKFENFLNNSLASNPALIKYLNPFQLMDTAKVDLKLAQMYFRSAQEKMIVGEMQEAQANSQQQAQVQIQSAQAAEQAKQQTVQLEGQMEVAKATTAGDIQSKNVVLTGIMNLYVESMKSGGQLPPEMQALAHIVLKNVALPAMAENNEILQQMQQQVQGAMQPKAMEAPEPEMAGEQQGQPEQQPQQQAA